MHHIFIVSDGAGRTAEQTIKAALTQFAEHAVTLVHRPEVRTDKQIFQVVKEAAQVDGIIIHTVVSNELRAGIVRACRLHGVETIDLMGPLLGRLSHRFAHSPSEKSELSGELDKEYFQRIEALIMASATPAAYFRGQNVQASDKYGIRGLLPSSSVAESGRCGDRSPNRSNEICLPL